MFYFDPDPEPLPKAHTRTHARMQAEQRMQSWAAEVRSELETWEEQAVAASRQLTEFAGAFQLGLASHGPAVEGLEVELARVRGRARDRRVELDLQRVTGAGDALAEPDALEAALARLELDRQAAEIAHRLARQRLGERERRLREFDAHAGAKLVLHAHAAPGDAQLVSAAGGGAAGPGRAWSPGPRTGSPSALELDAAAEPEWLPVPAGAPVCDVCLQPLDGPTMLQARALLQVWPVGGVDVVF